MLILGSISSESVSGVFSEMASSCTFCVLCLFHVFFSASVRSVEMIPLIAFSTSGLSVSDSLCLLINLVEMSVMVGLALLHVQTWSLDSAISLHLAHWFDWYSSHFEYSMSAVGRVPVRSLVTYDLKKLVLAVVKPDIGPPSTLKAALVAFQSISM